MRDDIAYIVTHKVTATKNANKSISQERIIGFELLLLLLSYASRAM